MQVRPNEDSGEQPAGDALSDGGFVEFYRSELDGQVRRAALLLRSDEAANDIVHDAFTRMYASWADIRDPGPYLNRAVLNGCRDVGRLVIRTGRSSPTHPNLCI